jgi:hypothetical protein
MVNGQPMRDIAAFWPLNSAIIATHTKAQNLRIWSLRIADVPSDAASPRDRVEANLLRYRMPWTDEFWRPIRRKAGRTLTTLGDAREFISTLPRWRQWYAP